MEVIYMKILYILHNKLGKDYLLQFSIYVF